MENKNKVFLDGFIKDVNEDKYNSELSLPFMTKELLIDSVTKKVENKIEKGNTPILTDAEIKLVIEEMKETSGTIFHLFLKYGFLEKNENDKYELSRKGKIALVEASKI